MTTQRLYHKKGNPTGTTLVGKQRRKTKRRENPEGAPGQHRSQAGDYSRQTERKDGVPRKGYRLH
jgi:hypothetical protein